MVFGGKGIDKGRVDAACKECVTDGGDNGVVYEALQARVPREDAFKGGIHPCGLTHIAALTAQSGYGGVQHS